MGAPHRIRGENADRTGEGGWFGAFLVAAARSVTTLPLRGAPGLIADRIEKGASEPVATNAARASVAIQIGPSGTRLNYSAFSNAPKKALFSLGVPALTRM
jgi:hypothetical protein